MNNADPSRARFDRVICRTTRKSYNIRTAASFCLMVGLDPGKSSIQAATWNLRATIKTSATAPVILPREKLATR